MSRPMVTKIMNKTMVTKTHWKNHGYKTMRKTMSKPMITKIMSKTMATKTTGKNMV